MSYDVTITQLKKLIDDGHSVQLYPRKFMVCVSGYKYYSVSKITVKWLKAYKRQENKL